MTHGLLLLVPAVSISDPRLDGIAHFDQDSQFRYFICPPCGQKWYTTFNILKFSHQMLKDGMLLTRLVIIS